MSSQGELRKLSGRTWLTALPQRPAQAIGGTAGGAGVRAFPASHFSENPQASAWPRGLANHASKAAATCDILLGQFGVHFVSAMWQRRKRPWQSARALAPARLALRNGASDKGEESKVRRLSSNQVSRTFADHVLRFLGTTKFRTFSQCTTRCSQEAARQPEVTVKRTGGRFPRCRQISGLKDRGVTAPICRRKSEIRSRACTSKASCPDGTGQCGLPRCLLRAAL